MSVVHASRAAALRFSCLAGHWTVSRIELSLRPEVVSRAGWLGR